MLPILISMTAGILIGFLFRHRKKLFPLADKITGYIIYLLLFLLGVSVGTNEELIAKIVSIGYKALIMTIACVLGSILAVCPLNRFFRRKGIKHEE